MPLGTGAAGGLGAFGMVLMPLGIVLMMLKQPPGPVAKLIAAGAVSSETARRCDRVDIPRPYVLDPAIRRRVVHRTEDGRYWVDVARARRLRRRTAITVGLFISAAAALAWTAIFATGGDGVAS